MGLKKKFGIALLVLLLSASPAKADSAMVSDISKQLICQCGCTLVLANCTHVECHSREAMTAFIEQEIAGGQSEPQIIQSFVDQYGEQVLASPPKRGFNLVAWVLPFVVILAGGGIIYIAIKKWVWQGRQSPTMATTEAEEGDEEYRRQLDKELAEFEERGFR